MGLKGGDTYVLFGSFLFFFLVDHPDIFNDYVLLHDEEQTGIYDMRIWLS